MNPISFFHIVPSPLNKCPNLFASSSSTPHPPFFPPSRAISFSFSAPSFFRRSPVVPLCPSPLQRTPRSSRPIPGDVRTFPPWVLARYCLLFFSPLSFKVRSPFLPPFNGLFVSTSFFFPGNQTYFFFFQSSIFPPVSPVPK